MTDLAKDLQNTLNDLHYVAEECCDRMKQVESFFAPGVEVTLIVRSPGYDSRDFMLSNDDLDEVKKLIQRRQIAMATAEKGQTENG